MASKEAREGRRTMSDNDVSEKSSAPWRLLERRSTFAGIDVRPLTVRDIARLAGVSTATVSRVVNGSGAVSRKTRTNVLTAISRLQYCPSVHAAELGRQNGGIPRKRGIYVSVSPGMTAKRTSDPGADALIRRRNAGQFRFLGDENTRLKRQVADLTLELETLRRRPEQC
jgi:hypothetical protein